MVSRARSPPRAAMTPTAMARMTASGSAVDSSVKELKAPTMTTKKVRREKQPKAQAVSLPLAQTGDGTWGRPDRDEDEAGLTVDDGAEGGRAAEVDRERGARGVLEAYHESTRGRSAGFNRTS